MSVARRALGSPLPWLLAVAVAFGLAVAFGEQSLSLTTALNEPESFDRALLLSLRLPRALLALGVGAALAVSGCALQALLRNPLADPFVLGVSGGAALGGALALSLGLPALAALLGAEGAAANALGFSPIALAAFLGALVSTGLVLFTGRIAGRLDPHATLLAGVVFNAFAAAGITLLKALAPPERVGALLGWLSGTLGHPAPTTLLLLGVVVAASTWGLARDGRALDLLTQGDAVAFTLGIDVERVRLRVLTLSSLLVATAVAVSGLVGFVGLLVPHLLRLLLGPGHRRLVPYAALAGAAFLALADLATRLAFPLLGSEAPVGVVTAMLGGPAFLWLLHREGERLA